jgi:phage gp46-like protein
MSITVDIRTRDTEACAPARELLWDTVWNGATQSADWAISPGSDPLNPSALQASQAIATAVILSIFTDRRCPPDHPLAKYADIGNGGDPRGYWGDGIDVRTDLGEDALGSLFWLLERSVKTEETKRWAQAILEDCLAWIVTQDVAASVTVEIGDYGASGISFGIAIAGRDGSRMYAQQFAVLWNQVT